MLLDIAEPGWKTGVSDGDNLLVGAVTRECLQP